MPYKIMSGEVIPDFVSDFGGPTVTAPWQTPPTASDRVLIPSGVTVTLDANGLTCDALRIDGMLLFGVPCTLTGANLTIAPGGCLICEDQPGTVIELTGKALDLTNDPYQFGTGFMAIDAARLQICGSVRTPFMRLAQAPKAGDTVVFLSQPVVGWKTGDKVLFPDSRELSAMQVISYKPQWEQAFIAGVSLSGQRVFLTAPLKFSHPGLAEYTPHVANLTRDVVMRSANGTGVRGHCFFTGSSYVEICYMQFLDLGRTTFQPLDNTAPEVPVAGSPPTHIGTNQKGRYPVHAHHLAGPMMQADQPGGVQAPDGTTPQFSFFGLSICNLAPTQEKWGVAIHGSHYGLINGNVIFCDCEGNTQTNGGKTGMGAGIAFEDGSESYNIVTNNFVCGAFGSNRAIYDRRNTDDFAHEGVGIWQRAPLNTVTGNVCCCCSQDGFALSFQSANGKTPLLGNVPQFPGDMVGVSTDMNTVAILLHDSNEAYACQVRAGFAWMVGIDANLDGPGIKTPAAISTVSNFVSWACGNMGWHDRWTSDLAHVNFVYRSKTAGQFGFYGNNQVVRNGSLVNPDIQMGGGVGVQTPCIQDTFQNLPGFGEAAPFTIQGGKIACSTGTGIVTTTPISGDLNPPLSADQWPPSLVQVAGVDLSGCKVAIKRQYMTGGASAPVVSDRLLVTAFNGSVGDDFEVFYTQQVSTFSPVPQTVEKPFGASHIVFIAGVPVSGLNNAQASTRYNMSIGGQIPPATAHARAGITGLVVP